MPVTPESVTLVSMASRGLPEKFLVAFSFAGEQRTLVRAIAEAVEDALGAATVFFDEWFEHYLAGSDVDLKLEEIYGTRCTLAVICVSERYGGKPWTLAEHGAIRARLMKARASNDQRDQLSILPIRVGEGDVKGILFNAIVPEVRGRPPEITAGLILDRLRLVDPGINATIDPQEPGTSVIRDRPHLDSVVGHVRTALDFAIRERCGAMKILTMSQPMDSGIIYQDVNIFENLAARQRLPAADAALHLNRPTRERIDGIKALNQHHRMMILGKPGAGKTTFLRRLAFLCIKGEYRADLIPAYLPLKEFTELKGEPDLISTLTASWGVDAKPILMEGRALLLLDGLDEVGSEHQDRILRDVNHLTANYGQCPVVITCRIAAREYTFERFTDVELADFTPEQAKHFCRQWFMRDSAKSQRLIQNLETHERIMDLATSPLLVSLMCLIIEEGGDIEGDRSQLYADALDVLLRKWDNSRNISRPYQGLTRNQKEDLLARIARARFEKGEFYFTQQTLEAEIGEEGEQILKAIESQHGLLIARAAGIYTFSHLTFQEYLTAKSIALDPNPNKWQQLLPRLTDPRWREVFQLLAELLSPTDEFLRLAERELARLVTGCPTLAYLEWLVRKSKRLPVGDTAVASCLAATRAAYWSLGFSGIAKAPAKHEFRAKVELDLAQSGALELDLEGDPELALDLELAQAIGLAFTRDRARKSDRVRGGRSLIRDLTSDHNAHLINRYRDVPRARDRAFNSDLALALERALSYDFGDPLRSELNSILAAVRVGKISQTQLREILICHRDIGHLWIFSEDDIRAMEAYEEGLITLTCCLKRARNLSDTARAEILNKILCAP